MASKIHASIEITVKINWTNGIKTHIHSVRQNKKNWMKAKTRKKTTTKIYDNWRQNTGKCVSLDVQTKMDKRHEIRIFILNWNVNFDANWKAKRERAKREGRAKTTLMKFKWWNWQTNKFNRMLTIFYLFCCHELHWILGLLVRIIQLIRFYSRLSLPIASHLWYGILFSIKLISIFNWM